MPDDGDRTPPDGSVGAGVATTGVLDDYERKLASSSAWASAATGVLDDDECVLPSGSAGAAAAGRLDVGRI